MKNLEVNKKSIIFALAFEHQTGGSNPSLSAINIGNQCFTKQTPDFTPKNVKSGVSYFSIGVQ